MLHCQLSFGAARREDTHSGKVAEGEYAEKTSLAASSIANND